jgi:nanoRNase/pAp phosphatase (c-di-AMP/oligoRNAs hydrolase)
MPNNPRVIELQRDHLDKFREIVAGAAAPWGVLESQVDLDGLGGTYGKAEIFRHLGAEAHPVFCGQFDDPQNVHVRKLLELDRDLVHVTRMPPHWAVALVDSCKTKDKRFGVELDPSRIRSVDDHHIPDEDLRAPGRFVHLTDCGAVSTMIYRQGLALGVPFSRRTCTLLALGIHSDTNKFRSPATTEEDCLAFAEVRSRADKALLEECFHYPLPPRYFALAANAYAGLRLIGPAIVSHPHQRLHLEESGYVSRYADRFLQYPGPKLAVVWGLNETHVRFSFRTEDYGYDLRPLIEHVCGEGNGGAKHCSGGAQTPIEELPLDGCAYDDEKIRRIESIVNDRLAAFFAAASG